MCAAVLTQYVKPGTGSDWLVALRRAHLALEDCVVLQAGVDDLKAGDAHGDVTNH